MTIHGYTLQYTSLLYDKLRERARWAKSRAVIGYPRGQDETRLRRTMCLLTEWECRTGKYLARGHDVRTERSELRAPWPSAKYFPVRPDLTQSINILLYDHRAFTFFFWRGGEVNKFRMFTYVTHFDRKVGPHTRIFSILLQWKRARGHTGHMIMPVLFAGARNVLNMFCETLLRVGP